jgi:hypothetical protein
VDVVSAATSVSIVILLSRYLAIIVTSKVCVLIKFVAITTNGINAALVDAATASVICVVVASRKETHTSNRSVVCNVSASIAVSIVIKFVLWPLVVLLYAEF